MSLERDTQEIPDWKLERFLLDELPPAEMEQLRQRVEKEPALGERLQALRESDRAIRKRYPATWMSREIHRQLGDYAPERRDEPRRHRRPRWLTAAVPMAAALAVLIGLPILFESTSDEILPVARRIENTRIKGLEPHLLLFRRTAAGSERLEDGAPAREHDLLLVQYQAAGRDYGVVLSIDGRGAITRHLPETGVEAARLELDGPVSLGSAYELDDAPDWERFYLVTSESPFAVEQVVGALRMTMDDDAGTAQSNIPLDLPDSMQQYIFVLSKETSND